MGIREPKYSQIARTIRQAIREGDYPIKSRLPDGKTLAAAHGVSLMTLNRALDLLVAEGYVLRRRGDGSFVRDWKTAGRSRTYSLNGSYDNYGGAISSKVLTFEVVHPSQEVADRLSLSMDDFVYHVVRLRVLEGSPIIMEYTYMPVAEVPGLSLSHVETSIYSYIKEGLGRKIHSTCLKISGQRPTALECQEMGLAATDFVMAVEQVSYLDNCRVFEYSVSHHLPDVFDFQTVMFNQ